MTPEVKDKFLELVKIWSIKEILSLKIRVALLIVWMNPYCIAFSMRLEAAGVRLSLRRLMLESVKIKESWLDRDSSDIKWSRSAKNSSRWAADAEGVLYTLLTRIFLLLRLISTVRHSKIFSLKVERCSIIFHVIPCLM